MRITIRSLNGTNSEIEVSPEDTVYRIMQIIQAQHHVPLHEIQLIFGARRLRFDEILSNIGVVEGSVIILFIRRIADNAQLRRLQDFLRSHADGGEEHRNNLQALRAHLYGTLAVSGGGGGGGGGAQMPDQTIRIYLRNANSDGPHDRYIHIPPESTVRQLYQTIHALTGIPDDQLLVFYQGRGLRLQMDDTLSSLGIVDDSVITFYQYRQSGTDQEDAVAVYRVDEGSIAGAVAGAGGGGGGGGPVVVLHEGPILRQPGRRTGGGSAASSPPPPPNKRVDKLLQQLAKKNQNWRTLLTQQQEKTLSKHQDAITLEAFRDPVTIPQSGHTFQRNTLREMIRKGSMRCPVTRKPLNQTLEMIDTMQPSFHVRDGTEDILERILRRIPPTAPSPVQRMLAEMHVDASERAPFQTFLREQRFPLQSSTQQQLKKAWARYRRLKTMSSKK